MSERQAVFLLNLLQDVNIVRPLIFMAACDLGLTTRVLVTGEFQRRDKSGVWRKELKEIGEATGVAISVVDNEADALRLLEGNSGVLIAASESNLSAHKQVHEIFLKAPSGFLKVTVQHGYESVGLLQSRDHDRAHGRKVSFAADVVCVWSPPPIFKSLLASERPKLFVTGPTAVLQMEPPRRDLADRLDRGLVCENLHSVRLNMSGDIKGDFLEVFSEFCRHLALNGKAVTLRPHPSGQYVLKNKLDLPGNVTINNNPIYKVDLRRYAYGISAPSSVIIDMVLAGIPTAVWGDADSAMDAGNYDGLTHISTISDWIDFSREAKAHPLRFLEKQERFVQKLMMPTEPAYVYERYAKLFDPAIEVNHPSGNGA